MYEKDPLRVLSKIEFIFHQYYFNKINKKEFFLSSFKMFDFIRFQNNNDVFAASNLFFLLFMCCKNKICKHFQSYVTFA